MPFCMPLSVFSIKRLVPTGLFSTNRSRLNQPLAALTPAEDVFKPEVAMGKLQQHIEDGLGLIRQGYYEEGMEHFYNPDFLKSVRLTLIHGKFFPVEKIPTTQDDIQKVLRKVHDKNWYRQNGSIELAQLGFMKDGQSLLPQTSAERKAVQQLLHEQALMYAEEHIHALQAMKGKNITFFPTNPVAHADEVDIATTLAHYNVPLTEAFLHRYNRIAHVPNHRIAEYH